MASAKRWIINGESLSAAEIGKRLTMSTGTVVSRIRKLDKLGMVVSFDSIRRVVQEKARKILYHGEIYTPDELSAMSGLDPRTITWRVERNWPEDQLLLPPGQRKSERKKVEHEKEAKKVCSKKDREEAAAREVQSLIAKTGLHIPQGMELKRLTKRYAPGTVSIDDVDQMDGKSFEAFVANLFGRSGFEDVFMTPASNDYGADILTMLRGVRCCVQCKRHKEKIGLDAVQEVAGAKKIYRSHAAYLVTNRFFTPSAIKMAEENGVILINRDRLVEMMERYAA